MPVSTYMPEGSSMRDVPGALDSDDIFTNFGLDDLGLSVSENGSLTISDPSSFITRLGLKNYTPENFSDSNFAGFKNIDAFVNFLSDAQEAGNTDKPASLYKMFQDPESNLQKEFSKKVSNAKAAEAGRQQANKALGIKEEPKEQEFKEVDGKLFSVPGAAETKNDLDQKLAADKSNPFLAGTEAERAQIANLLDIGNGKVAMPDRSDNRSVARFNNAVKSKEFVLNAAKRKARDLQARGEQHRNLVNSEGMQDVMQKWIDSNASHAMAKKGLDNWTDRDKIAFFKNYKMGNFDAPEPQKIPIFDENGLVGYQSEKAIKSRLGEGETFGVDPNKPNRVQRMERRNNQMLDEIRDEIKETGKHPFGEGPVLGTDYAREVALRDTFDGGDIGALKKSARDFRDGAVPGRNYTQSVGIPNPMPKNFEAPEEIFEPSQKMVSQDMLAKNNEEVNSVLDSVSFPRPKATPVKPNNPVKTLPFSLDNPTDNTNGEKAQRRANADKAYADWQSRYGEGVRERKAFMDQRMQDREQEIKAKRQAAQAEAALRPGQPASESRTVHDVFKEQELKRRQQASPFYNKNIFG